MYTQGVIVRSAAAVFVMLAALSAQQPAPREKAADYPAHAQLPTMEIGAEYLVHSIPVENGSYVAKEYLVVEVAVFPSTPDGVRISSEHFTLRINGKTVLYAQTPGMVAASLKYPDWETRPNLTVQAGPVVIGAPPVVGRFPDDPRPPQTRLPRAPRVPDQTDSSGMGPPPTRTVEEAVARAALPEGPSAKPVKGSLYFPYQGKMKSIRSLELIYDRGEGAPKAKIPLF